MWPCVKINESFKRIATTITVNYHLYILHVNRTVFHVVLMWLLIMTWIMVDCYLHNCTLQLAYWRTTTGLKQFSALARPMTIAIVSLHQQHKCTLYFPYQNKNCRRSVVTPETRSEKSRGHLESSVSLLSNLIGIWGDSCRHVSGEIKCFD